MWTRYLLPLLVSWRCSSYLQDSPGRHVTAAQKSDTEDLEPARRYGWADKFRIKDQLTTKQSVFWIVVEVAAFLTLAYFWPLSR